MDIRFIDQCRHSMSGRVFQQALLHRQKQDELNELTLIILPAISIAAFLCSSTVLALLIVAMLRDRISKRKCCLSINRLLGDITTSMVTLAIVTFGGHRQSAAWTIEALFFFLASFAFLHLSFSHLFVILVGKNSIDGSFKMQLNIRNSVLAIAVCWLLALPYAGAMAPLASAVILTIPTANFNHCPFLSCQRPLLAVCICIITLMLITIPSTYIFVAVRLRSSLLKANTPGVQHHRFMKFVKYAPEILLYCLASSGLLSSAVTVMRNAWSIDQQRENGGQCQSLQDIETVLMTEWMTGLANCVWIGRIILDSMWFLIEDRRKLLALPCDSRRSIAPILINARSTSSTISRNTLRWQRANNNRSTAITAW